MAKYSRASSTLATAHRDNGDHDEQELSEKMEQSVNEVQRLSGVKSLVVLAATSAIYFLSMLDTTVLAKVRRVSTICATAQSSNALIGGRVVAGLGGAGFINGCLGIVSYAVPPQRTPGE